MARVISPSGADASDRAGRPAGRARGDHGGLDGHTDSRIPSARREQVLQALRASPRPRTIASLAEQLHVHPNTVRFHLAALHRAGQVDQSFGETTNPGRPPILFRATRTMAPDGPTNYQLLATILTSHLAGASPDPTHIAIDLGRAWGPRLVEPAPARPGRTRPPRIEALNRLTHMLSDLGFAPEAPHWTRDSTIRLRHCPFLTIVGDPISENGHPGQRGNVICSLHLGVMQGALAAMDSPVTVDRLDPFAEPDRCVAHLAPAKPASAATVPPPHRRLPGRREALDESERG